MKMNLFILLLLSFLFSGVNAQDTIKKVELKMEKDTAVVISGGRFILNDRIYRSNAPYFTLGYGAGYNIGKDTLEQNLNISFHYFFKDFGLFAGYHTSSDIKIWWRSYQKLNDLYLGIGKRWESTRFNVSIFGGPSLAYGSYIKWDPGKERDFAYGFTTAGLMLEGQITYRILYDVGIGLTVYSSLNRYYQVAGAQLHLFFSTAFVRNYE